MNALKRLHPWQIEGIVAELRERPISLRVLARRWEQFFWFLERVNPRIGAQPFYLYPSDKDEVLEVVAELQIVKSNPPQLRWKAEQRSFPASVSHVPIEVPGDVARRNVRPAGRHQESQEGLLAIPQDAFETRLYNAAVLGLCPVLCE
jgi:hypothetical protein